MPGEREEPLEQSMDTLVVSSFISVLSNWIFQHTTCSWREFGRFSNNYNINSDSSDSNEPPIKARRRLAAKEAMTKTMARAYEVHKRPLPGTLSLHRAELGGGAAWSISFWSFRLVESYLRLISAILVEDKIEVTVTFALEERMRKRGAIFIMEALFTLSCVHTYWPRDRNEETARINPSLLQLMAPPNLDLVQPGHIARQSENLRASSHSNRCILGRENQFITSVSTAQTGYDTTLIHPPSIPSFDLPSSDPPQ